METNRKYFRIFNKSNKDESGYALVIVLGIVILTIGILSSMTLITISDANSSNKNRSVLEARLSGESVLDTVYAGLNASNKKDILIAANKTNILVTSPVPVGVLDAATGVTTTKFPWSNLYRSIDNSGVIGFCDPDNLSLTCFKIRLITKTYKADFNIDNKQVEKYDEDQTREEYTIDLVIRHKCSTDFTNCTYSRLQQTISKRKYLEYVSISQSENLSAQAKAAAFDNGVPDIAMSSQFSKKNAYSNSDVVSDGNIHTNDTSIISCNNAELGNWLTAKSGAPSLITNYGFTNCDGAKPVAVKKATRNELKLPERIGDDNYVNLKAFADADTSSVRQYSFSEYVNIQFNGTQMQVDSAPYPLPPNGVIYLEAGGSISGVVDGRVTIVSKPGTDITISDDLTYPIRGNVSGSTPGGSLTGVSSGGDIIISCGTNNSTDRCKDIHIDAFLKTNTDPTRSSTIYNPNWATAVAGATPPKVTLFGAMESYFRGTIGSTISYPSSEAGKVSTGFAKDYKFDTRLREEQPPFMLRDGSVPFIRSGVKDVPCDDGTGNVCD